VFAGHVGAGLALGRTARRLNVGVLVLAALLLDVLLWALVYGRVEGAVVPPDFVRRHYLLFTFPYSHGLAASLAWSAAAGALTWAATRTWAAERTRASIAVAAAVLSHWVLDALVHVPELPLLGGASPKIGLGLWDHPALALALEIVITLVGLVLFLSGASLPRTRAVALSALVLAVVALTVAGMTVAPPPPDVRRQAVAAGVSILVVSMAAGWLGRTASRRGEPPGLSARAPQSPRA
jgi:hypothetical protein